VTAGETPHHVVGTSEKGEAADADSGDAVALLRAMLGELRGLRSDMRRSRSSPELVAALDDYFGSGTRFTVAGLLDVADDEPHGALASALADVIDLGASARSRATALGRLLARLPEIEIVAQQRGCAVYCLRTCAE